MIRGRRLSDAFLRVAKVHPALLPVRRLRPWPRRST